MKQEYADKQAIREAKQKQYDREHAVRLENMKAAEKRKEQRHKAEMEKRAQEHAQKLKQMQIDKEEKDKNKKIKQKNDSIKACTVEIGKLDKLIDIDTKQLETEKKDYERSAKQLEAKQLWIDNFATFKQSELDKVSDELQLKAAKIRFERDDEQIKSAIDKTGQVEENVGRFLILTHHLLGATVATTAHSNKLQAQIATFDELMGRECSDKLSIEQLFYQKNLSHFTEILANCSAQYVTVEQLKCEDDEEYDDLLKIIQKGLVKQEKELAAITLPAKDQQDEKDNDDAKDDEKEELVKDQPNKPDVPLKGEELAIELLNEWDLMENWDKMKERGWSKPKFWKRLVKNDDELEKCGIVGGFAAAFIEEYEEWLEDNQPVSSKKRKLLKMQQKYPLIAFKEIKILKEICFKPDTWEIYQKEQTEAVKEGLMLFSPLLSDFFWALHKGCKQSQNILSYEVTQSTEQQRAIKMVENMAPSMIEYKEQEDTKENDNGNEVKDEGDALFDEIRKEWKKGSKCQIYSQSKKKWINGEIVKITKDGNDEWLDVKYGGAAKQIGRYSEEIRPSMIGQDNNMKIALQCRSLATAAIISIDVTDSMMQRFEVNIITLRALTVARGVEDCCMQIIKSQSTVRQSVLLAQEILKLKPAKMSKEGKTLWDAVDAGIIRIYKNAIAMDKAAAQYFGFFLLFRQAFQWFESNKDKSMMTSLKNVHSTCRSFGAFRKEFDAKVNALCDEALDCIKNCVVTMVGADNFEKAKASRERTLKQWLDKKAIYDRRALDLDDEFEKMQLQKINISSEKARLEFVCSMRDGQIKGNMNDKKGYVETKAVLDKMVI